MKFEEIFTKTQHLNNWQRELEEKSNDLTIREEVIRMQEEDVEKRMRRNDEIREVILI